MKHKTLHRRRGTTFSLGIVSALTVAALAACGGGSGSKEDEKPESPKPPASTISPIRLLAGHTTAFGYQDGASGDALLGPTTALGGPLLAPLPSGGMVIYDRANRAIRKFTPATATVSTLVENLDAEIAVMTTAPDGSLYFVTAEPGPLVRGHVVHRLALDGTLSVAAGLPGVCSSEDGPLGQATLCSVDHLASDRAGNLYVSQREFGESKTSVRKIDFRTGQISTVASFELGIVAFAVEHDGSLLLGRGWGVLERHRPDGSVLVIGHDIRPLRESRDGPAAEATFQNISDVVVDAKGRVFVLEAVSSSRNEGPNIIVRQIDGQGNVSTAGRWTSLVDLSRISGSHLIADPSGSFYVAEFTRSAWITRLAPDGTSEVVVGRQLAAATIREVREGVGADALLPDPLSLTLAPSGQLLVGGYGESTSPGKPYLATVSQQSEVRVVAHTMEPAASMLQRPDWRTLVADKDGHIFASALASASARSSTDITRHDRALIFRIAPQGTVEPWVDLSQWIGPFAHQGKMQFFRSPISGMAMDKAGMLYVAGVNGVVLKVTPDKEVTVLAGQPGAIGHTDGTAQQARFSILGNLAIDCEGNVLVLDGLRDDLTGIGPSIRKITPQGVVSTIAGNANNPSGLVDGPAPQARFSFATPVPWEVRYSIFMYDYVSVTVGSDMANAGGARVASDQACNTYVTDPEHHVIRRVSSAGQVETALGRAGRSGFLASPLPGVIHTPGGIAVQDKRLFFTMRDAVAFVDLP